ncbi:MAG: cytidylate kinase-like family protein [Lachnospiraceae bacterium]|jgi:cytidylate kinase|nr:cytidylate kinase-like family protein [Lachnospiraceae bacterium]
MEKFTITIAREFGSLGRPIAKELSAMLGVEFYDRDIVEEAAQKLNMPLSKVSDEEEKSKRTIWPMMFPLGTDEDYMQDVIFQEQKEIILDLARKSSCILVGRCSYYLLAGEKNNLNVYIYAPYKDRVANCVAHLGMTEHEAGKVIAQVDKARNAYYKRYAGYLPDSPEHMHLMVDSSVLGVTGTAKHLASMAREKFG